MHMFYQKSLELVYLMNDFYWCETQIIFAFVLR